MKHLKIKEDWEHWSCTVAILTTLIVGASLGILYGLMESNVKCDEAIEQSIMMKRFLR